MIKVAIAGASGFVGKNLIKGLQGTCNIRALGRSADYTASENLEYKSTDLFSEKSTLEALKGVDVAIYLVHSMMPSSRLFQGNFHDTDLLLADNFATACKLNGVKQIIYLGGLVPDGFISEHLQSRQEVEGVLQSSGIPVTVLRAGMIVGPGGSSFEILRSLVRKLPFMILPKWTLSHTQAIFIDDVVRVIQASINNPEFLNQTVDVVNGERLTYRLILQKAADALGLKRVMVPVPIASTGFSKLWVQIFGNSTYELVSPLIDSLLCDLPQIQPRPAIRSLVRFTHFEEMVRETMKRDSGQPTPRPQRKLIYQDSVRSIQRLPSVSKDCHYLAMEYMKWLPSFLPSLIRVNNDPDKQQIEIRLPFLKYPLLILKFIADGSSDHRKKFHIVGGLLSKTKNTGWLEFRQVDNKKYTLVSINEFVPRLPWPVYVLTQAQLHLLAMKAFGRHLLRQALR